jgi:outer membrane protein assembly factor BamD (BamD/ComL family)
MCRDMKLCDAAVVKYQRVVDLFPDTPWATVARQRLEEIKQKGEIS